nr:translation initiation factor IF-2-like isoform X1 [Equus asinus]
MGFDWQVGPPRALCLQIPRLPPGDSRQRRGRGSLLGSQGHREGGGSGVLVPTARPLLTQPLSLSPASDVAAPALPAMPCRVTLRPLWAPPSTRGGSQGQRGVSLGPWLKPCPRWKPLPCASSRKSSRVPSQGAPVPFWVPTSPLCCEQPWLGWGVQPVTPGASDDSRWRRGHPSPRPALQRHPTATPFHCLVPCMGSRRGHLSSGQERREGPPCLPGIPPSQCGMGDPVLPVPRPPWGPSSSGAVGKLRPQVTAGPLLCTAPCAHLGTCPPGPGGKVGPFITTPLPSWAPLWAGVCASTYPTLPVVPTVMGAVTTTCFTDGGVPGHPSSSGTAPAAPEPRGPQPRGGPDGGRGGLPAGGGGGHVFRPF